MKKFIFILGFLSASIIMLGQSYIVGGFNGWGDLNSDGELISQDKTYDETSGSNQNTILNPDYAHRTSIEHIVDESNLDDDSVYVALYMDTYQYLSLHYNLSGGTTITVYVSNDDTADDADETSGWVDYSTTLLGAASVTDAEGFVIQDTPLSCLKILVKVVTTDATNAADAWVKCWY